MYSSIAKRAMEEVWGRTPNHFQSEIIPLILQMMAGDLTSEALLLVQPTGSGKSSVPQTASVITSGVTIIIEPTLSLSSDQSSKFNHATNVPGGLVYSYQLDLHKNEEQRTMLATNILTVLKRKANANIDTGIVSFILFTSPETIILPTWTKLFDELLQIKMLNLLCIDEVHLFIEFGLSFRRKFLNLRNIVFNKLIKRNINNDIQSNTTTLKIPIVCMTATFNTNLLQLLQQMTNITFNHRRFFWSPSHLFKKRHIHISIKYSSQYKKVIKDNLYLFLKNDIKSKAVVCSNTAKKVTELQDDVRRWMTCPTDGYVGTTALVVGKEDVVRKLLYTVAFTNTWTIDEINNTSKFTPRVLLGTAGCIGAGLDSNDVHLVQRVGMPTSRLNLIQEMGRCGRKITGEYVGISNCYHVIYNLKDFVYLNERLYTSTEEHLDENNVTSDISSEVNDEIISIDDERKLQQSNILSTAQLFSLNMGCWHILLEEECGIPSSLFNVDVTSLNSSSVENESNNTTCNGYCPRCDGTMSEHIRPINGMGVKHFLVESFGDKYNGLVSPIELSKQLYSFENVGEVVYKRKKSKKAESIQIVQNTVLQLLAANIIRIEIDVSNTKAFAHCKLCFDKRNVNSNTYMQPHYAIDEFWKYITEV